MCLITAEEDYRSVVEINVWPRVYVTPIEAHSLVKIIIEIEYPVTCLATMALCLCGICSTCYYLVILPGFKLHVYVLPSVLTYVLVW